MSKKDKHNSTSLKVNDINKGVVPQDIQHFHRKIGDFCVEYNCNFIDEKSIFPCSNLIVTFTISIKQILIFAGFQ